MPQRETERSTGDLERLYSLTGDLLTGDLLLMAPLPLLSSNASALSRMLIPVSVIIPFACFLNGCSTQTATQVRCNGAPTIGINNLGTRECTTQELGDELSSNHLLPPCIETFLCCTCWMTE